LTQGRRVKLSANQRTDMWSRWKAGQSLHEIGRAFGKDHVSIQFMLSQHGGIVPATRRRSLVSTHTGRARGPLTRNRFRLSIREIAKGLQRAVSTESREVARHSRFTALVKVPSKDTAAVVAALRRHVRKLPASLRRSLTWDRGLEMAKHKTFTVATNVKVYFCDPQSPWQRGSNENTNGLLRQYLPKRTDLSVHTQAELDKIALRLNQRPRKTLGFETPASRLRASVATTH